MFALIVQNSIRFVLLILLQGLVLNNIRLNGYINPYVYVLFIMLLPFETPRWVVLTLGFITGLSADYFTGTIGMHASATVFLAFVRSYILKLIAPREGYEFGTQPRLQEMGFTWFLFYCSIMVVSHHSWLYLIEAFRFSAMPDALLKSLFSSGLTILLIFFFQFLGFKVKQRT